jgi:hypothetical protein
VRPPELLPYFYWRFGEIWRDRVILVFVVDEVSLLYCLLESQQQLDKITRKVRMPATQVVTTRGWPMALWWYSITFLGALGTSSGCILIDSLLHCCSSHVPYPLDRTIQFFAFLFYSIIMKSHFNKLSIITLLSSAFSASALMHGSTRGQHSQQADDTDAVLKTRQLQASAAGVCEAIQVVALKQDLINPQVFLADGTGMRNAYIDLYDPTSPKTSYVTESRRGVYVVYELTTTSDTFNVCYKTGSWTFSGDGPDDIFYTRSMCDGSLIDGTFDHVIGHGTGKYECATGNIIESEAGDVVTFDLSLCSTCA